jgi:uncharacterized membrane protein YgaE (UPF0421/DUF939 family)
VGPPSEISFSGPGEGGAASEGRAWRAAAAIAALRRKARRVVRVTVVSVAGVPGTDRSARREALAARGQELRRQAGKRSRASIELRRERFALSARPILHTAVAAAGAWLIAKHVLMHSQPFFAPVSAVIALGLSVGQRGRRAVEVAVGVAVGIGVADALVYAIGTGAAQIALVVALAMAAALIVGGGPLLASQAAVSAVLVATIQQPHGAFSFTRFYDALVGGVTALIVSSVFFPIDPVGVVHRRLEPLLDDLGSLLDQIADALEDRDSAAAEEALAGARQLDPLLAELHDAVEAAGESARISPARRRSIGALERHVEAARQVDYAYRNVRVLARGVIRAISLHDAIPPTVHQALRELAAAARGLAVFLRDPERGEQGREAALRAAALANSALEDTANMSVSHVVAQIRSTATDFLRAYGVEREQATEEVRTATP